MKQTQNETRSFSKMFTELTKFEIAVFEFLTAILGYLIGHSFNSPFVWPEFLLTSLGVLFLAAGSGGLNQYQEHSRDILMNRTKNRPIPSHRMTPRIALYIVLALILLGAVLLSQVSLIVCILGVSAAVFYNGFYTLWWKPKMAFAAIPGAIPGALPVLVGYQAATQSSNIMDIRGWYLFGILFFWQMPHFWVLALKYSQDYAKGGFPTLPVTLGVKITKEQITVWTLAYAAIGLLAGLFFQLNPLGAAGILAVSLWLIIELRRYLNQSKLEDPQSNRPNPWLRFFLIINFSMLFYLGFILVGLL